MALLKEKGNTLIDPQRIYKGLQSYTHYINWELCNTLFCYLKLGTDFANMHDAKKVSWLFTYEKLRSRNMFICMVKGWSNM